MEAPRYDGFVYIAFGLFILAPLGLWKAIEIMTYLLTHVRIVIT